MTVLITGIAGFIGFHLARRLLADGFNVVGIDNLNDYYSPVLKQDRVDLLFDFSNNSKGTFDFYREDITNLAKMTSIFIDHTPTKVVHLAAQAGVRYSMENPSAYISSNLQGFGNIIECCRQHHVENLIYASSSSVYGGNKQLPFSESHSVDHPLSLYAATKKSNELIAHSYSNLFGLPTTGLRFFTVYGPWGRPDMALFLFTEAIISGKPIRVFNNGLMNRDFTYIDDIIESIALLLDKPAQADSSFETFNPHPGKSFAPYRVFNVGNSNQVSLLTYIEEIEKALSMKATKELLPMQPGDVADTLSDTTELRDWIGFTPSTSIKSGIGSFIQWYREYYSR